MRVRNGVDIVAVERIEKSMKRPGFIHQKKCWNVNI